MSRENDRQVWLSISEGTGMVVRDQDVAAMSDAEFDEFWARLGSVVRTMALLIKSGRERDEAVKGS